MEWNEVVAARFTELRLRELSGKQTSDEQAELTNIISELEADEAQLLAPYFARVQAEQDALRENLTNMQTENDELVKLLSQQEQLVADARRWLADFDNRNAQIQRSYSRLMGESLAS